MAKKKVSAQADGPSTAGSTTGRPTATRPPTDPAQRLIDAALALALRQRWSRTGMAEIAAEAGLPLDVAYAQFRSKTALLDGFMRRVDRAVLAGATGDDTATVDIATARRDRLFDTLMRRFDALQPHKDALRAILGDGRGDPSLVLNGIGLLRSMAWMLEASGITAAGWRGGLRAHLLVGIYLPVLRVFFDDASPDLARTMATLDRLLRRSERFLAGVGGA
jgi:AcrR family transcriptional regulator